MWNDFLKFLNDNKDSLGLLLGSGVLLAILGGIYRFGIWLFKELQVRKTRSNDNFPFKIIPPNSNVAKEILGGADNDPLADRNIPYQQRNEGRNTRREIEEALEQHRWVLITGISGLGKTREAVNTAQSLNNEGWTVLCLTHDTWLEAPARLPKGVPDKKILFFLDDLNRYCRASSIEQSPRAQEQFLSPRYEPFQTRLQQTLESIEILCGNKADIRVVATARNEKTSDFEGEPSQWEKLDWDRYEALWKNFPDTAGICGYLGMPDIEVEIIKLCSQLS